MNRKEIKARPLHIKSNSNGGSQTATAFLIELPDFQVIVGPLVHREMDTCHLCAILGEIMCTQCMSVLAEYLF